MTDDVGHTYEEAITLKKRLANEPSFGDPGWKYGVFSDPNQVAHFLNLDPPQGAGGASVTNRADGRIDLYWYVSG